MIQKGSEANLARGGGFALVEEGEGGHADADGRPQQHVLDDATGGALLRLAAILGRTQGLGGRLWRLAQGVQANRLLWNLFNVFIASLVGAVALE
jgi:hypothetical protein